MLVIWKPVTIECCGEERRERGKEGGRREGGRREGGRREGEREGRREGREKRDVHLVVYTLSSQVSINKFHIIHTSRKVHVYCNNRPLPWDKPMLDKDLSYQTTTILCEL